MVEKARTFKKIYLEPNNLLLSEIMANGKSYIVPLFQRDYSWEDIQWEELWSDIVRMRRERVQHFMGYLVLRSSDGKIFEVIDGQQRLTTFSIIVLAAMAQLQFLIEKGIEGDKNRERINIYNSIYITGKDAETFHEYHKLVLNRHNKSHFRSLAHRLQDITERNLIQTNRRLNNAFLFFRKRIDFESGEEIAALLNDMADGLTFTTISVADEMNAFIVFETLNARGIHLSTSDLLKNYLLSCMVKDDIYNEENFDDFEEDWEGIVEQLGENEFTKFLRSHEAITKKLVVERELFRSLKKNIYQPNQVIPYLQSLKEMSPIYAALQDHNDSVWSEKGGIYKEACQYLEVLNVFKIKTPLALLMAGYKMLSPSYFVDLVRFIVAITIRYNVICDKSRSEQEKIYNKIANELMNRHAKLHEVTKSFSPLYPGDQEFQSAFSEKSIPGRGGGTNKRILYLLGSIERQCSNDAPPRNLTLEHILPYSPNDRWQEYFGRGNYSDAINRLGNLAIVPENQQMEQEPFTHKKEILKASSYEINYHIAEYPAWNMDTLREHQRWMAQQAIGIWKISQLGT